jgi:hypothetical protein
MTLYRKGADGAPFQFGDVFSCDWLHDAVLRGDAVPLRAFTAKQYARAYAALPPKSPRAGDYLLTHGDSCRAVLVSDDCEVENWTVRHPGRGRLLMAALSEWPEDEAAEIVTLRAFRRHPLPPDESVEFAGGIAEFQRTFAVDPTALAEDGRILQMEDNARASLEQRWAAYATRRGPFAALDNADKIARLLDANGDKQRLLLTKDSDVDLDAESVQRGRQVAIVLARTWRIEGEIMNRIADAYEGHRRGNDEIAQLADEFATLAADAQKAAADLKSHAWITGGPTNQD